MYRQGLLPSGDPMRATVQGDVRLEGSQLNCMGCHRRSGLGASEGGRVVPPVTGPALYQPREMRRQSQYRRLFRTRSGEPALRPAYTDESLARAIRAGLDPDGRPLDALMPRYMLSDADMAALVAYLKSLSSGPDPGVTDSEIHLATVVAQQIPVTERQAMIQVLEAFVRDKNAETRHELKRARHGPWYKDYLYGAYRKWALHVWELTGDPSTWGNQLEDHYRRQPVFALVSGIAEDWRPIHGFADRHGLPTLFPNTRLPVVDDPQGYTLYLSKGLVLEAEALAVHLLRATDGPMGMRILQIYDARGEAAARAFRQAIQRTEALTLHERRIEEAGITSPGLWGSLLGQERPSALVLWLEGLDLETLAQALAGTQPPEAVYLSSSLGADIGFPPPKGLQGRVYLVYPHALPEPPSRGVARGRAWLRAKHIPVTDEALQANTYFAISMLGMALKGSLDLFSREYLIERVEHMTENALSTGSYPHLSLGPAQRFASKGAYIVQPLGDGPRTRLVPVSDWIVP